MQSACLAVWKSPPRPTLVWLWPLGRPHPRPHVCLTLTPATPAPPGPALLRSGLCCGLNCRMVGLTLSSLITLLIPWAVVDLPLSALMACRILQGIGQGLVFPSFTALWAHWALPAERSRLSVRLSCHHDLTLTWPEMSDDSLNMNTTYTHTSDTHSPTPGPLLLLLLQCTRTRTPVGPRA